MVTKLLKRWARWVLLDEMAHAKRFAGSLMGQLDDAEDNMWRAQRCQGAVNTKMLDKCRAYIEFLEGELK